MNENVNGVPKLAVLDVASQTRPSGVTRGSEPLSPIPRLCWRTRFGVDQFEWVPFRRASAYDR